MQVRKNLNFKINDFKKFKEKINYIIIEDEPKDLVRTETIAEGENSIFRTNAKKEYIIKGKQFLMK